MREQVGARSVGAQGPSVLSSTDQDRVWLRAAKRLKQAEPGRELLLSF